MTPQNLAIRYTLSFFNIILKALATQTNKNITFHDF